MEGLSEDGSALVVRDGEELLEVPLDQVHTAVRAEIEGTTGTGTGQGGPAGPAVPAPTPREVQARIRRGESAERIARLAGVPVAAVERYEGPVLADRAHQARLARRSRMDGRDVDELVTAHLARSAGDTEPVWDSWLVDGTTWRLRITAGPAAVELDWDAAARRVRARDEDGRRALGLAPAVEDALGAVLRPRSTRPDAPAAPVAPVAPLPAPPAPGAQVAAPPERVPAAPAVSAPSSAALDPEPAVPVAPAPLPPAPAPGRETAEALTLELEPLQAPPVPEPDPPSYADPEPAAAQAPEPTVRPRRAPPRPGSARGRRAAVPNWDAITTSVTGRPRDLEQP